MIDQAGAGRIAMVSSKEEKRRRVGKGKGRVCGKKKMGKRGKKKTILSASKEMANGSYRRKASSFPCRGGIRWVEEEGGGTHILPDHRCEGHMGVGIW